VNGIYDSLQWAVVFHYSSVEIQSGATVTFKNHPSGAPVVWLVDGNVTIDGNVNLDGDAYNHLGFPSEPGAGGFRGGKGNPGGQAGGAGFGPGGGQYTSTPGTYGSSYGNLRIVPLIGGSGGGGSPSTPGGGAGGGAILIASNDTIDVVGTVSANGGVGGGGRGSGGAIRLVADVVRGIGTRLIATNDGLVRVEANDFDLSLVSNPIYSFTEPNPVIIWPGDIPADSLPVPGTNPPTLTVASIAGQPVPLDPSSRIPGGDLTLAVRDTQAVEVVIVATSMPLDWEVVVRVTPRVGNYVNVNATMDVGGLPASSIWRATLPAGTLPMDYAAIQARASKPQP
jgi:hypothetical protein